MIFVTTGTQLPFDRLLRAMDDWAAAHPGHRVEAQTGNSGIALPHLATQAFLPKPRMDAAFTAADVIVGHAGMGTILTGLSLGKPVIVMPRKSALGEHRNDHQAATAQRLAHLPGLHVVEEAEDLADSLDACLSGGAACAATATPVPGNALVRSVAQFVRTGTFDGARP